MDIVTREDINYLSQQSSGHMNMILCGMMNLMENTDTKIAMIESQKWFQRMVKTVAGKNKITLNEIQKNHDKLNAYMSEAIAELYNRNCIDHKVMMSLGTQLNELYVNNLELKQMLGAFVSKLNEKIDSIDNFHMLITEIDQGVYSANPPIISIFKVIAQFDNRILDDNRKLDIIKRSLITQEIINNNEILLKDFLISILEVPVDEMGEIYLELSTIHDNFIANIFLRTMDKYYFLPEVAQKIKNNEMIVREIVKEEKLNDTVILNINEFYDGFIDSKLQSKSGRILIGEVQIEEKLKESEKLFLNCKLDEAFELFKVLAEQGNARAMYFMGEYYIQGYGHVVKDNELGMKWRQKGYELGDALSSLNIAYSFPEASQEADKMFNQMFVPILRLAESGDIFAQNEIATLYGNGYGVEIDEEKQLYWLLKSAENGYWNSMNELGDWYKKNEKESESFEWYKKASEIGYANAQNKLGLYYLAGTKDTCEAFYWFMRAAEQGLAVAQYNLAYCYRSGKGIEQDLNKAKEWYREAFENGHDKAGTELGLLANKEGDYKEAINWYKKAAQNGEAQNKLGLYYLAGTKDTCEAFYWFMRAAEQGLAVAQYNLAYCYRSGKGIEQDLNKAKEWYREAFENGYDKAGTELGLLANKEGDYKEAINWYKKAAQNGEAEAQNRLGLYYFEGTKDTCEAFYWFMRAAEQGLAVAQYNLAYCYRLGKGIEQDLNKAKEWYREAFENGYDKAGTELGLLANKEGDYKEAINWYKKAAQNGEAEAQNRLGLYYFEGIGVEVNKSEAFYWYMKAAEQGLAVAQYNLAYCYRLGKGMEQDLNKAKHWLRKSAQQGHNDAKKELLDFYKEQTIILASENLNNKKNIEQDTSLAINLACKKFLNLHDSSQYHVGKNLKSVFNILDKNIYIAHDDTVFQTGKNGFAITEDGIYFRRCMDAYTTYIPFEFLAYAKSICVKGSCIYADENVIAFNTHASKRETGELKNLFEQIAMFVRDDLNLKN